MEYELDVELDDEKDILRGAEKIRYINNAPNELQCIYMHLWPNAYLNETTALARQLMANGKPKLFFADEKDQGSIDSLNFKVDGEKVEFIRDKEYTDVGHLFLNDPLESGDTITITTPFRVKIPKGIYSRLGHIGDSYQVTQWYPKPAVYDQNGWHEMPYLDQGEFYSEYGSFDVSITVPENYVLDATGKLMTNSERTWLRKKASSTAEKKSFGRSSGFPASSEKMKTLRFQADSIHDFAWFADKRYNVLQGQVTLPHTGRKVTTRVLFTDKNAGNWQNALEYLHDAVYNYSLWLGDYPYNKVTAVDGTISAGGGMEYPMITVIGSSGSAMALEQVITHEVGHNWFYGILGSNERQHPWMDEGLNSYYENRYLEKKYPDLSLLGTQLPEGATDALGLDHFEHRDLYYLSYLYNARRNFDQPIELPAPDYTQVNYGAIPYGKTALAFDYLEDYLGVETFDRAMKRYYEEWKFQHPQPSAVQEAFKAETDKRLDWFFDDLLTTNKKIDYKITDIEKQPLRYGFKYKVTVKNAGDIAAPFPISVMQQDTVATRHWMEGFHGKQELELPYFTGKVEAFKIDGDEHIPEVNRRNNQMRTHGLFKRMEKPQLQFLAGIEDPDRSTLYFTPLGGWNTTDRWMAGIGFYNTVFPEKAFDFTLAPMYAFESNRPVGTAEIGYDIYPRTSRVFQHIRLQANGKQFSMLDNEFTEGYFRRFSPQIRLDFRKSSLRSPHQHGLDLNYQFVEEVYQPQEGSPGPSIRGRYYAGLTYRYDYQHTITPFSSRLNVLHEQNGLLGASLTLEQDLQYDEDGNAFHLRLFGGKYFINTTNHGRFNWQMDGVDGFHDHTYQYSYMGRMETSGIWSQQFVAEQGAFKVPTAYGQSNNWLAALNLSADLPFGFPLALFADIGMAPSGNEIRTFYDAGGSIPLIRDILEIHVPVFYSQPIQEEMELNNVRFWERIRFTLRLDRLDPFEQLRNLPQ